ncbi:hypothetical protein D3C72_1265170 [compost metagenome]
MTTAEEHHVRLLRTYLGHHRIEVFLAARQALVHHILHATFGQRRLGRIGKPLPIGVFIVNDHHSLGLELVDDEVAGHLPLLVIPPAHAEHVAHATLGDQRVGRARGDGDDPRVVIHLRGRHSGR